jgi:hypothetical protein
MINKLKIIKMKKKIIFAISAFMIMALAVLNMKVSFNDAEGSGVGLDALQMAFAGNTENGGIENTGSVFKWKIEKEKPGQASVSQTCWITVSRSVSYEYSNSRGVEYSGNIDMSGTASFSEGFELRSGFTVGMALSQGYSETVSVSYEQRPGNKSTCVTSYVSTSQDCKETECS